MRRVFAVALLLAACGGSPSSPSQPAGSPPPVPVTFADFAGLWTAKYRITACEWERHCGYYIGTERSFDLRLVQTGSHVRGLFVDQFSVADVEGDVSTDGTLVMTGYRPPATSRDGSFRITDLRVQRGTLPELQGQVSYESRLAPQYSDVGLGMKATGAIVSAARSDLSTVSQSVEGSYRGRFAVRSCVPLSTYCYPVELDDVVDATLVVGGNGGSVSATFQRGGTVIALHGTLSGRTLSLSGESTNPQSGGDTLDRVSDWQTAVDDFGRMSGTFHLDDLYPAAKPTFGARADCELVSLVKSVN